MGKVIVRLCRALSVLVTLAAPPVQGQAPDSLVMAIARTAIGGASEVVAVWPGYFFGGEFVLCSPEGPTVLALEGEPPPELGLPIRVEVVRDVPTTLRTYLYPRPLPGLERRCIDIGYEVGTRQLLAWTVMDSIYTIADPLSASVTALYHETFHLFQGQHFANTRGPDNYAPLETRFRPSDEVVHSAAFGELASLERTLLADAMGQPVSDSLRSALRTYLAVRWKRTQLLPTEMRSYEAHEERKEGSAHIVGYRAAKLVLGAVFPEVEDLVRADLLTTPSFNASDRPYRTWHIYGTGGAIALLLERFRVDWRSGIQDGATFEQLLTDVVSFTGSEAEDLFLAATSGRTR